MTPTAYGAVELPESITSTADGTLYAGSLRTVAGSEALEDWAVAENLAGADGFNATITPLGAVPLIPGGRHQVGDTVWGLQSKLGKMGGKEDPGMFYAHPVALQ
ncbi:MAG: hypothetical protein JWP99_280 [Devosia sp.]|nr:hypothetical protein [Devosia sp.]